MALVDDRFKICDAEFAAVLDIQHDNIRRKGNLHRPKIEISKKHFLRKTDFFQQSDGLEDFVVWRLVVYSSTVDGYGSFWDFVER